MKNNLSHAIIILSLILLAIAGYFYGPDLYDKYFGKHKLPSEDKMPAITVNILNGCGFSGATKTVKQKLESKNVFIVKRGNARKFIYDKTIIVVKKDDEMDLRRLMKMTGIKRYIYAINKESYAAFDIILGKDFEEYFK